MQGKLTIDAGMVVKVVYPGSGATGIEVAGSGSLAVDGSGTAPVVFTSVNDNTVGGATGSGSPAPGDYFAAIHVDDASGGVSIRNAVFEYASTAVSVDELNKLEVDSSEFSYNLAAFSVASTPGVSGLLGQLVCAPPYTSFITGQGDWFGGTGLPGASIDIESIAGLVIPRGLSRVWPAMSSLIPPGTVGDNTIPWTLYTLPGRIWYTHTRHSGDCLIGILGALPGLRREIISKGGYAHRHASG